MSRSWCFTLNNYTEKDIQFLKDLEKTYMCVGKEVGESGTPHLQGYITFNRTYRLPQLKKLMPRAHLEVAKSKDAMNYCMKEGDYIKQDNRRQPKLERHIICIIGTKFFASMDIKYYLTIFPTYKYISTDDYTNQEGKLLVYYYKSQFQDDEVPDSFDRYCYVTKDDDEIWSNSLSELKSKYKIYRDGIQTSTQISEREETIIGSDTSD